jgi:hypothetical protein
MSIAATRAPQTQTVTFFPTSAGVKGHMLNATTATIVAVNMANANNNNKRKQQQKNKAIVTRMPRIMHATIAGQAANQVAWQSQ